MNNSFRNAYLLSVNPNSERTIFSKKVLEKIGFNVIIFLAIPNQNPLLSHRQSYLKILEIIANQELNNYYNIDGWTYVFEDDINLLEDIYLDEICEYEKISNNLFYLGICKYGTNTIKYSGLKINNKNVYNVSGNVRGAHALAFSKNGAKNFLDFEKQFTNFDYIDMIIELFTKINPANIIRVDLESYISGHLGIIFQDRNRFASIIS